MSGSTDGTTWDGVSILRNATFGLSPPNGGGSALFAINSIVSIDGHVMVQNAVAGFSPMPGGGSMRVAMKRALSGGTSGWSGLMFICSNTNDTGGTAYMLGLEDKSPSRIVLAKGTLNLGIPGVSDGGVQILRTSTKTIPVNDWVHLRVDAIVQGSGDVVLRFYESDLVANPITAPVWTPIACTDAWTGQFADGYFIDDVAGINTNSAPLTSGHCGFGSKVTDISRRAYFDGAQLIQQA
jgi:hypothetical protein